MKYTTTIYTSNLEDVKNAVYFLPCYVIAIESVEMGWIKATLEYNALAEEQVNACLAKFR